MNDFLAAIEVEEQSPPSVGGLAKLTIADGLYFMIVAIAAVVRLVNLGKLPLSSNEAQAALSVWQLWQPGNEAIIVTSPAYFSLTSFITQVLGYTDAVMRLVPVLFGLALLCLPWLLRQRLGNVGMLTFTLLLAVSPLHMVISRTAGGEAIALFATLLLAIAWIRYQETAGPGWLYTAFIAAGLGMASSPLFYGGLVSLLLAWATQAIVGPSLFDPEEAIMPDATEWRRAILIGGGFFVAIGSMLVWYPPGLAAAAALPAKWLSQFTTQANVQSMISPLLAIGRYELILLLPGLIAVIWSTIRNRRLGTFCIYWIVSIVVLLLLQRGQMEYALLLTLPGYLLLSLFTNELYSKGMAGLSWGLAGGIWLAGMLIFVNVARYSRSSLYDPDQFGNIWIAFLAFTFSLIAIYFIGTWRFGATHQGTFLGVLALLLFYQWGTGWWLSHDAANDPRERWVNSGTDDDLQVMVNLVRGISRESSGSDYGLDIFNAVDTPVMRWYLREFDQLETGAVVPAGANHTVIISRSDHELALSNDYTGADFGLSRGEVRPANPEEQDVLDTLRWWLFHESSDIVEEEKVILWWRADLVQE